MDVLDRLRVSASPAIATVNGTSMVFLGAWNGNFYALNAVTGKKIWSFTVDLVPPCKTNSCRIASLSRLSWKWRERSSVKIAERTYEERA